MRGNLQKNQELEVWDVFSAGKQRQGNRSRNSQQYRSKPYKAQGTRNREQQYGTTRTQGRKQIDSARAYDKQRRDLGKTQDRKQSHASAKDTNGGQKYSSRRMQSKVQQTYSASGARNRGQQYNTSGARSREQYVTRKQQHNSGATQGRGRQYVADIPQSQRQQRRESQAYRSSQNSRASTYKSKSAQIARQKKSQRRHSFVFNSIAFLLIVVCLTGAFMLPGTVFERMRKSKAQENTVVPKEETQTVVETEEVSPLKIAAPIITVDFLEVNEYSRPGTELSEIKNIFVHYTANPKTSAKQNRSYFSNLAETHERSASAHFIIGYTGEIIQCIPMDEQAYAVIGRNEDSISIECCYIQKDGQFTQETYDSLIKLLAWLMQEYELESKDILRHYDCGGKRCPLYYVDHEDAWIKLLKDVDAYIESFETPESEKKETSE